MLEVSGLSFHYQPHVPVLTDLTFSVLDGEIVGLLGKNGVGKTTTLKLIFASFLYVHITHGSMLKLYFLAVIDFYFCYSPRGVHLPVQYFSRGLMIHFSMDI